MSDIEMLLKEQNDAIQDLKVFIAEKMAVTMDRLDKLEKEGYNVIKHHFPSYGTYQGRPVEEYLKGNYGKISELSPYFSLMLVLAHLDKNADLGNFLK